MRVVDKQLCLEKGRVTIDYDSMLFDGLLPSHLVVGLSCSLT